MAELDDIVRQCITSSDCESNDDGSTYSADISLSSSSILPNESHGDGLTTETRSAQGSGTETSSSVSLLDV